MIPAAGQDSASAVFAALADPTRRRVVELLARDGEQTATQLAAMFPISRQALTKHLAMLAAAELVVSRREGKERRYAIRPASLEAARAWMASVGAVWDERLTRLAGRVGGPGQ